MLHEFSNPKLGFAIGIMRLRGLTGLRTCGVAGVPHLTMAHFGSFAAAIRCKASSPSQDEVLVEEGFSAKVAILNRPKKLNALTTKMVEKLRELYEKWEKDRHVRMVIITGAGRGFCAGGDVATVYHLGKSGMKNEANDFFAKEYLLNYILGTYKKIHVALLNGIVMGGGNGISIHGKFRVATENTQRYKADIRLLDESKQLVEDYGSESLSDSQLWILEQLFAMPETAIGLHPDVGASYFLSRLPGHLGEYLGLTGTRLNGAEMLSCGLATHFVPSQRLADLEERLGSLNTSDVETVGTAIDEFCDVVYPGEKSPLHWREAIDRCFQKENMEEIMHAVEAEAQQSADEWYENTLNSLKKMSPISLKVTLRSIREGRQQSLYQCLEHEYRVSVNAVNAEVSTDFYEGCRAVLVDKDNTPKWDPPSLEEVTPEMVSQIFAPLREGEELQLPVEEREGRRAQHRARL